MTIRLTKHNLLIAIFGVGLLLIGSFVYLVINAANTLIEAENRSRATLNTCYIIAEYLSESEEPRWPTSWDDLSECTYAEVHPHWPDDRAYYEANVMIDFNTDLQHVADLTLETFDVIQPIGNNTSFHDYGYNTVIDGAKEALKAND